MIQAELFLQLRLKVYPKTVKTTDRLLDVTVHIWVYIHRFSLIHFVLKTVCQMSLCVLHHNLARNRVHTPDSGFWYIRCRKIERE